MSLLQTSPGEKETGRNQVAVLLPSKDQLSGEVKSMEYLAVNKR